MGRIAEHPYFSGKWEKWGKIKRGGVGIDGLSPGWFLPPSPLPSPPPARYIGCYVDNTRRRTLRGVSFFDYKKMTVFRCQDNCAER